MIQLNWHPTRVIQFNDFCFTQDDQRVFRVFKGVAFGNVSRNIPLVRSLLVEEYLRMDSFMLAKDLSLTDIEKVLSLVNPNAFSGPVGELLRYYAKKCSEEKEVVEVRKVIESIRRPKIRLDRKLSLSERAWDCPHCGQKHDRDVNAALNIRDEALYALAKAEIENPEGKIVLARPRH